MLTREKFFEGAVGIGKEVRTEFFNIAQGEQAGRMGIPGLVVVNGPLDKTHSFPGPILEAIVKLVEDTKAMGGREDRLQGGIRIFEVRIRRIQAGGELMDEGTQGTYLRLEGVIARFWRSLPANIRRDLTTVKPMTKGVPVTRLASPFSFVS